MLMLRRSLILGSFLLIGGCLDNATTMMKSVVPVQLNSNEPVIAQIDKQHKKSMLAVGADIDRKRNQSSGLGLIKHSALENYANEQLTKLKKASGFESAPGRVYLFADTAFGARASADGNIYIPYAVIIDLKSSDELAALLAHELSHTIRGHSSSDIFVKVQKKGLAATSMVANFRKSDTGVVRSNDMKNIKKTMASVLITDGFINPGWTRVQESEADKLGLDIMIKAGYNPDGMFVLLDKVAQWDEKNSHIQQQRDAVLENMLGSFKLTDDKSALGQTLNSYFTQGATRFGAMVDSLNKSHDSAETRYDALLEYADKHYGDISSPALETRRWNAVAQNNSTKTMWQALQDTLAAREAIAQGNYRSAEKLIAKAKVHAQDQNFVNQTLYELGDAQRKNNTMQNGLNAGLKGQYPSLFLQVEKTKLASAKADKVPLPAAQGLANAFDAYGRPADYYNEVMTLLSKSDMKSQVLALQAECVAKYVGEGISCNVGDEEKDKQGADFSYKNMMKSFL